MRARLGLGLTLHAAGEHRAAVRELTVLIEGGAHHGQTVSRSEPAAGGEVEAHLVPGGGSSVHAAYLRASCWHALGEYRCAMEEYARCVALAPPPPSLGRGGGGEGTVGAGGVSELDRGLIHAAHYQGWA